MATVTWWADRSDGRTSEEEGAFHTVITGPRWPGKTDSGGGVGEVGRLWGSGVVTGRGHNLIDLDCLQVAPGKQGRAVAETQTGICVALSFEFYFLT